MSFQPRKLVGYDGYMPPLTTEITARSADEFTMQGACFIAQRIRSAIVEDGRCLIGLSGGSTPGPVYTALGNTSDIDWSKVWIFPVDDRYVRKDSPHSNQFLVRSTLLQEASIPESQILFPNTTLPLEQCVAEYDAVLTAAFARHPPDLLILGMGPDGHIASLFPPLTAAAFGSSTVIHTTTDRFAVPARISLTIPALQHGKEAMFLLRGKTKRMLWEEMLQSSEGEHRWPAKAIIGAIPTTVLIGP